MWIPIVHQWIYKFAIILVDLQGLWYKQNFLFEAKVVWIFGIACFMADNNANPTYDSTYDSN